MQLNWQPRIQFNDAFLERDGQIVAWVGHRNDGAVILICNRHQPTEEWIHSTAPSLDTAMRWCEEWARRPQPEIED